MCEVSFIVDCQINVGLGHLSRSNVVAKRLVDDGYNVRMYLVVDILEAHCAFDVIQIDARISIIYVNRRTLFRSLSQENNAEFLVIDTSFSLDIHTTSHTTAFAHPKLHKLRFNNLIFANPLAYLIPSKSLNYYAGLDYAIVKPELLKLRKNVKKLRSIGVTLGGSSDNGITKIIVQELIMRDGCDLDIHVVTTRHTEDLEFFQNLEKHHKIVQYHEEKDMGKFYGVTDFIFCAGGTTSYECAALGRPFFTIGFSKAHELNLAWERVGLSRNCFILSDRDTRKRLANFIDEALTSSIDEKSRRLLHACDGQGHERIARLVVG